MYIVFGILCLIIVGFSIAATTSIRDGALLALFLSLILIVPLLFMFRWQISSNEYTGYIYSRRSAFGYTTYHIRYSQNAGNDEQPSFTVKSGSDEERRLDALVGGSEKVKVMVPSASPKLVNNPFEPASYAELKEVKLGTGG